MITMRGNEIISLDPGQYQPLSRYPLNSTELNTGYMGLVRLLQSERLSVSSPAVRIISNTEKISYKSVSS